jgi:hypothetical protein
MQIKNSQSLFLKLKPFILNIIHQILDFKNFPTKKESDFKVFLHKTQQFWLSTSYDN